MSLSKIYLTCVKGGIREEDVIGYALAEDGMGLGSHLSSNIWYSQHDMGLTSDWKHENYNKHYPDGFELEWINEEDLDNHDGWQKVFKLNQELKEE